MKGKDSDAVVIWAEEVEDWLELEVYEAIENVDVDDCRGAESALALAVNHDQNEVPHPVREEPLLSVRTRSRLRL